MPFDLGWVRLCRFFTGKIMRSQFIYFLYFLYFSYMSEMINKKGYIVWHVCLPGCDVATDSQPCNFSHLIEGVRTYIY